MLVLSQQDTQVGKGYAKKRKWFSLLPQTNENYIVKFQSVAIGYVNDLEN